MWSFGWNDTALFSICTVAVVIILILQRFSFTGKQPIIALIFFSFAIVAALACYALKHDVLGTLLVRALLFEFIAIYILGYGGFNGRIRERAPDPQH